MDNERGLDLLHYLDDDVGVRDVAVYALHLGEMRGSDHLIGQMSLGRESAGSGPA